MRKKFLLILLGAVSLSLLLGGVYFGHRPLKKKIIESSVESWLVTLAPAGRDEEGWFEGVTKRESPAEKQYFGLKGVIKKIGENEITFSVKGEEIKMLFDKLDTKVNLQKQPVFVPLATTDLEIGRKVDVLFEIREDGKPFALGILMMPKEL